MTEVYLISPNTVRTLTNMSTNMQDKFLISAIREASDMDFQEVVGTNLYNKLKELVANDEIIEIKNKYYKGLLDIAKYFLAYTVIARIVVISSIKLDNIGANITSDDKANTIDVKDVFSIEDHYYNKADFYKKRVQDYILANRQHFKELNSYEIDKIQANLYSAASSNIWLGGIRGKQQKYK